MRPAIQYRPRRQRVHPPSPPPLPQPVAYATAQPLLHPDDGKPLGAACRPAVQQKPSHELLGDARAAEVAKARAEHRAPRFGRRGRPRLLAPLRHPTAADLTVLRESAMTAALKVPRSPRGAGPLLAVVLSCTRVLSIRVGSALADRECDAVAAQRVRLPSFLWRAWAVLGWRRRWSYFSLHAGSRWCGRRGLPGLRSRVRWAKLWDAAPWHGVRLLTVREWSARTSAALPGWMGG